MSLAVLAREKNWQTKGVRCTRAGHIFHSPPILPCCLHIENMYGIEVGASSSPVSLWSKIQIASSSIRLLPELNDSTLCSPCHESCFAPDCATYSLRGCSLFQWETGPEVHVSSWPIENFKQMNSWVLAQTTVGTHFKISRARLQLKHWVGMAFPFGISGVGS